MIEIVHYPHPALRFKSVDVTCIDDAFRRTVREMFELMYAANGIGLAANQVALPFRFFIMNPTGEAEQSEAERVFVNPVIRNRKGTEIGEEGCLSLPGLYGDVRRAQEIVVEAFDVDGQEFRMTLTDLPARVVQHEVDHLDGVLFIDKISEEQRDQLAPRIADFQQKFRQAQQTGELANDEMLTAELRELSRSRH